MTQQSVVSSGTKKVKAIDGTYQYTINRNIKFERKSKQTKECQK